MQVAQGGIYIYCFRNTGLDDCQQSYIGSTYNFAKRHDQHLKMLRQNKHYNGRLQGAFNKYGEDNFEHLVVEEMLFPENYDKKLRRELLECRESYFYNMAGSYYNLCDPGEPLIKRKIKVDPNISNKIPIYHVDDTLNIIKKYSGLNEAARELGACTGGIKKVATLKLESTNGMKFRLESTLNQPFVSKKPSLLCYDLDGNFVKEYLNISEASKFLGIKQIGIRNVCSGKRGYTGKWIFRFKGSTIPVKPLSAKKLNSVVCYIDGYFYKEYSSMNSAARDLGLTISIVNHYCNSFSGKIYKNKYQFKYKP